MKYDNELLNHALRLVTEWGEDWHKPIHDRIRVDHPDLTDDDIDELTRIAREAESYIYKLGEDELRGEITESQIPTLAREKFSWLDTSNTSRLTGIAMFYARK